jgi:hypothetical protein
MWLDADRPSSLHRIGILDGSLVKTEDGGDILIRNFLFELEDVTAQTRP